MLKGIKLFINEHLKQKFNLYNFFGHVIIITTSILLAQIVTNIDDDCDIQKEKLKYFALLKVDLDSCRSDLKRDLNGHKRALKYNLEDIECIKNMYLCKNFDIDYFNNSISIDYFFTDFQFYPFNSTFYSLLNKEAELLEKFDTIGVKNLYLYDFERIKLLGKEFSQTRNLNAFWEKLSDEYFYISPDEEITRYRIDSYGFGSKGKNFHRHKSSIKNLDATVMEKIYTKLEKTIEIRDIKIKYYENVLNNIDTVLTKIK